MKKIILFGVVLLAMSLFGCASFGDLLDTLSKEEKAEVFECWKTKCHGLKSESNACKIACVEKMIVKEPEMNYYDDFSIAPLDLTRWIETHKDNLPFTEQHLVTGGVYHIEQSIPAGRSAQIIPTRLFQSGETLEFDIYYNSGSGNNLVGFARLIVNGAPLWLQPHLESCSTPISGCGVVGNWNQITDIGNQIGKYHIKMEFFETSILMTTTRPDSTTITNNYVGLTAPYQPLFTAQSGHDGTFSADYDNFLIS